MNPAAFFRQGQQKAQKNRRFPWEFLRCISRKQHLSASGKLAVSAAGDQPDLPEPCQLRYGDEGEAPGRQNIHDVQRRVDGGFGGVVHENNVPVPHLIQHRPAHRGSILGGPVPGIHGPADHRQSLGPGYLVHTVGAAASGGTQQPDRAFFRQEGPGAVDLPGNFPAAHGHHVLVGVAVDADLMALLPDFFRQLRDSMRWHLPFIIFLIV